MASRAITYMFRMRVCVVPYVLISWICLLSATVALQLTDKAYLYKTLRLHDVSVRCAN